MERGEVCIFDDVAHAMKDWGQFADDVESEVITFYDADGTWLRPLVTQGPRRLGGLLPGIRTFELVRDANLDQAVDPIWLALFEASTLIENSHVASLSELRALFPKMPPNTSLERTRER